MTMKTLALILFLLGVVLFILSIILMSVFRVFTRISELSGRGYKLQRDKIHKLSMSSTTSSVSDTTGTEEDKVIRNFEKKVENKEVEKAHETRMGKREDIEENTSYMEENVGINSIEAGNSKEATSYVDDIEKEVEEATSYLGSDDELLVEDEENTSYLNSEDANEESTSYLDSSEESEENTSYLDESSEEDNEATSYLDEDTNSSTSNLDSNTVNNIDKKRSVKIIIEQTSLQL